MKLFKTLAAGILLVALGAVPASQPATQPATQPANPLDPILAAIKANPAQKEEILIQAVQDKTLPDGRAALWVQLLPLLQHEGNQRIIAIASSVPNPSENIVISEAHAQFALNQPAEAEKTLLAYGHLGNPSVIAFLLRTALAQKDEAKYATYAKGLFKASDVSYASEFFNGGGIYQTVLGHYHVPPSDPAYLYFNSAQNEVNFYKAYLRKTNGRLNVSQISSLVTLLTKGTGQKVLVVSNQAKAFGTALGQGAPAGSNLLFWSQLLQGQYSDAIGTAMVQAKNVPATLDTSYTFYIQRASKVIVVNDQCYNGRALDFIKYINGDLATNPVPDLYKD